MSNKKTCGIYKITNTLTNEAYIGQSKNIEKRIATHKEDLENGTHVNKGLQEDYDLAKSLDSDYEIFTFEIIKEVEAKDLNKEEMYWINEFNSFERGYNRTSGGSHDETKGHVDYGGGRLFTDEKRIKLITKELTDDFANKENYIFKTTSNEVICSKCGKEFNDEFDFCPYCGTKKPQPKICPKCKLEPSIEFSFCPKCGTELLEKEEYLEQIEKKKKIKEYERLDSEQEKLEEEWKKGHEICDLKEKTYDYPFEKLFDAYNEIIRIYDSIDEETYNGTSPYDIYFDKYDLEYLKEEILEVKDSLKIINKIYEYEEILENDEWTFNSIKLFKILIDYFKSMNEFDVMFGVYSEDELKKWYGILDKATTLYPNEFVFWREKGIVLHEKVKFEQAIECYKKALEINPKDKETYVRLLDILTIEDPDEALKYCNNALKEYPLYKTFIEEKLTILDEIYFSHYRNLSVDEEKLYEKEKLECYAKLLILGVNISEKFGIEENEEILNLALDALSKEEINAKIQEKDEKKNKMSKERIIAKIQEKVGLELEKKANQYYYPLGYDDALNYYLQAKEFYSTINSEIIAIGPSIKRCEEEILNIKIEQSKYAEERAKNLEEEADKHFYKYEYDEAKDFYKRAKEIYDTIDSEVYNITPSIKRCEEQIEYINNKKNIFINPTELIEEGKSLEEMGEFFYDIAEYDKALDYYEQAVELYNSIDPEVLYIEPSLQKCDQKIKDIKFRKQLL